jgi:hypothetical protein
MQALPLHWNAHFQTASQCFPGCLSPFLYFELVRQRIDSNPESSARGPLLPHTLQELTRAPTRRVVGMRRVTPPTALQLALAKMASPATLTLDAPPLMVCVAHGNAASLTAGSAFLRLCERWPPRVSSDLGVGFIHLQHRIHQRMFS